MPVKYNMDFNVLTRRRTAEDNAVLATRMTFDKDKQHVSLERFRVLTCPDSLSVERLELDLSAQSTVLELYRNRPTFCGLRLDSGKIWDFVFESKEHCRTFAGEVNGRICLDGEFFAEEENASGFEVITEDDPEATVLVVGGSVFLKSSNRIASSVNGVWQDISAFDWRRDGHTNILRGFNDEEEESFVMEFQTRASRERFLACLPKAETTKVLRIFSGTWNVGNASAPTPRELARSWLDLASVSESGGPFDLYAFGLQECSKKEDWTRALMAAVGLHLGGEAENVTKVAVVTMREVMLAVFSRSSLNVSVLGQDVRPTGIANTIGNKGAVGVGLDAHEFGTVAIVSAHLSAFQDNVKRRAQDQRMILKHLNLRNLSSECQANVGGAFSNAWSAADPEEYDNIETFDRVIFLGDLNYRIDMGSPGTSEEFEKVELMARGGRWTELAPYDQLGNEMRRERVFFPYKEAKPIGCFPPTYRMNKDQQGYSNKRDQNPSFTDRILFRGHIDALNYGANHELVVRPDRTLTISDHRPVYAALQWPEEERNWDEPVTCLGANQKDLLLQFNNIFFKPLVQISGSDRVLSAVVDENTRFQELDAPADGKAPFKRRLSGFASSSRYLLKRNNSNGTSTLYGEEEDQNVEEDALPVSHADESVEFRILAPWSTDFPAVTEMCGNNGFVRSFGGVSRLRSTDLRIGVFCHRVLIGYARFVPVAIDFDQETYLEVPVASRGARVGDLCLRLQLAWN